MSAYIVQEFWRDPWEAVLKSIEGRNFPSVNLHLSFKIEFWPAAQVPNNRPQPRSEKIAALFIDGGLFANCLTLACHGFEGASDIRQANVKLNQGLESVEKNRDQCQSPH